MKLLNKQWPQKRKCIQCGKEFKIINYLANNKKYCSIKCSNRYRYVRKYNVKWPQKKNCIVCGIEFLISMRMGNKKYCSRHCGYITYRNKKAKSHKILCLYCGKEIKTTLSKKKYCSNECGIKYHSLNRSHRPSKAYLEKNYPDFICQNCRHKIKLNFDPKSKEGKLILKHMKCPKCLSS